MSIRHVALYVVIAGLSMYAWKDWFKSLCGLLLLMAVFEHEDMPKAVFGVQGLNPWNMLFVMVAIAWAASRHREGLLWDMPRHISVLLLIYLAVILIGVLRAVFDRAYIADYPLKNLISEELINTVKWALPAILLFDGCRTRRRVVMALVCILAVYVIVAIQVGRFMPPGAAFGDSGSLDRLRVRLGRYIGYSACDISAMLAGASWAILASLPLIRRRKYRIMGWILAGVVAYGQSLTGGRAGFVAWGATGFILCLLKWRKYLILAPVVVILLPAVFPAAAARMLSGFGQTDVSGQSVRDDDTITSGRNRMWPRVIDKIGESPVVGHGRLAMKRTGLYQKLLDEDLPFAHPHNVYLETLLDNGLLGSLPIVLFWGILIFRSAVLFRSPNRLYAAIGGLSFALLVSQAFAGIGAQHYYPRVSTVGMWVAAFLMLRVSVEEERAQAGVVADESTREEAPLPAAAVPVGVS
ncbi:MAG: O-antigen ligase family protein [Sedimentisphaerales bacterium]|nr:O-antigen ligase family protein [Sedimentisphaerales bacterium]